MDVTLGFKTDVMMRTVYLLNALKAVHGNEEQVWNKRLLICHQMSVIKADAKNLKTCYCVPWGCKTNPVLEKIKSDIQ